MFLNLVSGFLDHSFSRSYWLFLLLQEIILSGPIFSFHLVQSFYFVFLLLLNRTRLWEPDFVESKCFFIVLHILFDEKPLIEYVVGSWHSHFMLFTYNFEGLRMNKWKSMSCSNWQFSSHRNFNYTHTARLAVCETVNDHGEYPCILICCSSVGDTEILEG